MPATSHLKMPLDEVDFDDLMKTLTDNFNVLADEVQLLSDRKIILEHKLRFAHEQYQHLADKYAPSDPEISNTLVKLQLPPELTIQTPDRATFVPLPSRRPAGSKQQTAEAIRDGRWASQKIASLRGWKHSSEMSGRSATPSLSGTTDSILRTSRRGTSATTVLEQDFTVPGKKSQLLCPFARTEDTSKAMNSTDAGPISNTADPSSSVKDDTPHHSADPICAALYAETHSSPPPSVTGSAAKCPIRYLDQHSPEEVAKYFETHKHEIPRSHEVCVKRYQRNEEDIRKLDAKYGNLVSMISGLGQKHQPMLPVKEDDILDHEESKKTNDRVENWAKAVSGDGVDPHDIPDESPDYNGDNDDERGSRFDRPMKEVRLGESPSRPWGISVPFDIPESQETEPQRPSTPPAPVLVGGPSQPTKAAPRCPFGHDQPASGQPKTEMKATSPQTPKPAAKCPFGHGQEAEEGQHESQAKIMAEPNSQPTFLQSSDLPKTGSGGPQMVFTGPVFIGYPIEQAMALMQQWQTGGVTTGQRL